MAELSDRVNAIVVKELRQGVRGRGFTWALLLVQIVAVFAVMATLGEDVPRRGTHALWIVIGIPVLLLIPVTALDAIAGERPRGALETVLLTRLSARSIAWGKWAAYVSQTALLLSSVIPFLVLRYFEGGVDIWADLRLLGAQFAISTVLVAGTVALAASPLAHGFRLLLTLFAGFSLTSMMQTALIERINSGLPLLAPLALCALLIVALVEGAAYEIAPLAERRPALVRAAACLAPVVAMQDQLGRTLQVDDASLFMVAAPLLSAGVMMGSLCEREQPAFARRVPTTSWRGLLAIVFGPGWPSGAVFTLILSAVAGAMFGVVHDDWVLPLVAVPGAFFVPLAILRLLRRFVGQGFRHYAAAQLLVALVAIARGMASNSPPGWHLAVADVLGAVLPGAWLLTGLDTQTTLSYSTLVQVCAAVSLTSTSVILLQAVGALRARRRAALEHVAQAVPAAA